MIIDAHAHLGFDEVFDEDFTEADLLESQRRNGIDAALVQPPTDHGLDAARSHHDAIAELARRHPGRFHGVANPNPHLPGGQYEREVRRCVEQLGFVGVKLHPLGHAVNPLGRHGQRAIELAAGLKLPLMVHTGAGLPWAAPSLLAPAAQRWPQLKIVLAHAGGMLAAEASLLAGRFQNVYLECSWSACFLIAHWVRQLGPRRVMFGSDHAANAAGELAKFRSLDLGVDELAWVLGGSAAAVFGLPCAMEGRP